MRDANLIRCTMKWSNKIENDNYEVFFNNNLHYCSMDWWIFTMHYHGNTSTYRLMSLLVNWQHAFPCVLQPGHDKTLGSWAGGTKGEQCQANGSSAGVHCQRQTVETATGRLPGRGRETTQAGERGMGGATGMLVCFHVWLNHFDLKRGDHLVGVLWSWDERGKE